MADVEFEAIGDAIVSHALTTGHFDNVAGHEPKNAPGKGISGALWLDDVNAVPQVSGLAATSLLLTYSFRIYLDMLTEPQDRIDPDIARAAVEFMRKVSADFTLDGLVDQIDLLGAYGAAFGCKAGYIDQDGRKFRVLIVTVPVLVHDVFEQSP